MSLPFFFFGTLMDGDVLARVLQRRVASHELRSAQLWGYRRHAVRGAVYPVLRPDRAGHVPGVVFQPTAADERARIDHFESEEYRAAPCRVQIGTLLAEALVYLALEGVFEVEEDPWCFQTWQATHKPAYLQRCDRWMADYVAPASSVSASAARAPARRWPRRSVATGGR